MNRLTRTGLGLVLALTSLPTLAASPAAATADLTGSFNHAAFSGVFRVNNDGDFETDNCDEIRSSRPGYTFPCRVAFRFDNADFGAICSADPAGDAVEAGTADYYSETLGTGVSENRMTAGGVGSTYRHIHGAIVDHLGSQGLPTFFDIEIDLTEACDVGLGQSSRYPIFAGVVTYS